MKARHIPFTKTAPMKVATISKAAPGNVGKTANKVGPGKVSMPKANMLKTYKTK